MRISAISFDADQTLWDFKQVQQKALDSTVQAMVTRGDIDEDLADPAALQRARDAVVGQYRGRPHNLEEVRRRSFEMFLEGFDHPSPGRAADDLLKVFLTVRYEQIRLYPDVELVIRRLARNHRIGLLSNGNTDPDRCGLPGVFDAVVLTPNLGVEKPDRRAFDALAERLNADLPSLVHVGDDWDDIDGANAVGAVSVFMNRTGANPEFSRRAQHEVNDLIELERLLKVLRS